MFDIGFWELIMISVLGLIVLGPERLPIAIRNVLRWLNSAKEMANSVKGEISQELKLHEMNENMIKASKQGLSSLDLQLQESIEEMKQAAQEVTRPYQADSEGLKQAPSQDNSMLDLDPNNTEKQDKCE